MSQQIYKDINDKPVVINRNVIINKETGKYELKISTNIVRSASGRPLGQRNEKKALHQERKSSIMRTNTHGNRFKIVNQVVYIKPKEETTKTKRRGFIPIYKEVPMFWRKGNEAIPVYKFKKILTEDGKIAYVETDEQLMKIVFDKLEPYDYEYVTKNKESKKKLYHRKNFYKVIPKLKDRSERSAKDLADYKQRNHKKKGKYNNVYAKTGNLAWEYKFTVDGKVILGNIKAMKREEALSRLKEVAQLKHKLIDKGTKILLTGNARYWIKPSKHYTKSKQKEATGS